MATVTRTNSWKAVTGTDPWIESFDGTGGNCLCVVIDQVSSWGGDHTPVKYNGVSMTEVVRSVQPSNNLRSMWYLVNPASGTNNIEVTLINVSTYPSMVMAAILMSGVNTSPTVRTLITALDGSASAHQLTEAASVSGDVLVGVYLSESTSGPPTDGDGWTPEAGTTEFCDHYHDVDAGKIYIGCCYRVAAGANATVNMTSDANNAFGSTLLTFIAASGNPGIGSPLYSRRRRRMPA